MEPKDSITQAKYDTFNSQLNYKNRLFTLKCKAYKKATKIGSAMSKSLQSAVL